MYIVIWLHVLLNYGLLNHRLRNHRLRLDAGAPIEVEKGVAIGLTADGERLGDGGSARARISKYKSICGTRKSRGKRGGMARPFMLCVVCVQRKRLP
jgi:hypothetical protein